jgi:hypothetical protein
LEKSILSEWALAEDCWAFPRADLRASPALFTFVSLPWAQNIVVSQNIPRELRLPTVKDEGSGKKLKRLMNLGKGKAQNLLGLPTTFP